MSPRLQTVKESLIVALLGLAVLAILVATAIGFSWYESQGGTGNDGSCNVADLKLYGALVYYPGEGLDTSSTGDQTASEDIREQIEDADADPSIKAIFLQIDSPGGDPVAGEDIETALKHASKPTVVLIADEGDSAAYWAATGAQTIFASANSSVGDIGVTESYLDETKQDEEDGLTFISLTAGEYKDMGDPDAPITPAERALFQRDLNITMQNFIDTVAANRNMSVASVTAIANGSSMTGQMGAEDGLVDKIGNIYDVEDYLKGKIGGDVTLCE